MYGFVGRLTPEQVEAIAGQLYVEMLKSGYTAVAEFHYLHHDPDGAPYADLAEMSERVIAAAQGDGHRPHPSAGALWRRRLRRQAGRPRPAPLPQRSRSASCELIGILRAAPWRRSPDPHRHRAAFAARGHAGDAGRGGRRASRPWIRRRRSISTSPSRRRRWRTASPGRGQRPVEWLLAPSARRPALVPGPCDPYDRAARPRVWRASGAVAGLCPTTEANLGDGFFPAAGLLRGPAAASASAPTAISPSARSRSCAGSNTASACVTPAAQCAAARRRQRTQSTGSHVGAALYRAALAGGALAAGRPIGRIAAGRAGRSRGPRPRKPRRCSARSGDTLLDALVFAGNQNPVRDVFVGGRRVVEEGRHIAEHDVLARFRAAMKALLD